METYFLGDWKTGTHVGYTKPKQNAGSSPPVIVTSLRLQVHISNRTGSSSNHHFSGAMSVKLQGCIGSNALLQGGLVVLRFFR